MHNHLLLAILLLSGSVPASGQEPRREIAAPEARQGVAVDATHVYAINNRAIGKYDKISGVRLALWEADDDLPLVHMNSAIVRDGQLVCAHSNHSGVPMTSSVEFFTTETLEHTGSHSFGILYGSLTWLDWHEGFWWACFAHYGGNGGEPGKGPEYTVVVKMDELWNRLESWVLPPELLDQMKPFSASGGTWGLDGRLYLSGHDRPELYVVVLPEAGSVLRHVATIPFPNAGQAIAVDRTGSGLFYGIVRETRTIVAAPVPAPED